MSDIEHMSSSKPYLIRAFYEWIVDNEKTPYLVLNTDYPGTKVPRQYIENGRIVLNISMRAVDALVMDNVKIQFKASFGGVQQIVLAPIAAVLAIYARENGKGMIFSEDESEDIGGWDASPTHEIIATESSAFKDSEKTTQTSTQSDDSTKDKPKKLPDYLHIIK